jgi:hypothetical protein
MTAVNALHRGLLILRAVNDGHAQVREISAATKLPNRLSRARWRRWSLTVWCLRMHSV